MVTTNTAGLLTLAEAAAKYNMPTKRLRRWVRLHKLGRPIRDAAGHYMVDPTKLERAMELVGKIRELREMMDAE